MVSFFDGSSERDITESAADLILMFTLREGAAFSAPSCDCEEAAELSLTLGSWEDCYVELAGPLLSRDAVLRGVQVPATLASAIAMAIEDAARAALQ